MQIQQARAHIMATLAGGESPRADADVLLCHLLGCRRSYLMTWPERELDAAQQARLQDWLSRRLDGEPIAHLIGEREFWSLPLKVSPATLIPRPDTEVLVEQALARLPPRPAAPDQAPCALLDLGTGTGATFHKKFTGNFSTKDRGNLPSDIKHVQKHTCSCFKMCSY